MKTITIKLSSGLEVTLTEEDKKLIDEKFANLDENLYSILKVSSPDQIKAVLEKMTNEELLQFAKLNDQEIEETYYPDPFSQKIYSEIFKRNNLGFKQLRKLSSIQRDFLKSLGLKVK
ncbi:hypothetical protein CEY12_06090 [Chryseobacterium sp. T16E-39]|uniref:hypothetical protein n=1 Tax=Chryseobacterium sp. T16E-39 TaxID=2015076 RepID=UPI000B5B4474|nr:hypothetical protein [Chryseobacterium sp. T16E-39]ASK29698.1 hypothetical protein CEY12_06090 [Chryseobacterium sp. T16E-39]